MASKQIAPFQIHVLPGRNIFRLIRRGAVLLALLALLATRLTAAELPSGGAADTGSCAPRDGLEFICGPEASEDIARIPETAWLIASGLNVGRPAQLYLIDTRSRTVSVIYPAKGAAEAPEPAFRAGCPRPPDPAGLSTDGLGLQPGRAGRHRLYVSNHGDRRAVEVFDVDAKGRQPVLHWKGCVPLPAGTLPNAVTPLPDGGFAVISFHDPDDPEAWTKMARGDDTGRIFEWHPGTGLREVAGSAMSGGNGIAVSPDGSELYASAWSGARIVVLSRRTGARREIPLPFLPDNLHWLGDGSLVVGGQRTTAAAVAACQGPRCPQPWVVARLDPHTGRLETLLEGPGDERVDYACGALAVDGHLYVTVRGDRRIVVAGLRKRGLKR